MAAVAASILCYLVAASPSPSVEIGYGKIVGTSSEVPVGDGNNRSVNAFLGIPYATPPVGALRYARPTPPQSWRPYVLQATVKGPSCVQFLSANPIPGWVARHVEQSEDCLYLNVWTPERTSRTVLKTVLVWIHGGGLNYGSASMDLYDGAVLAGVGDVVVVSMNYRLGSFGFLALGEGGKLSLGNQGLMDQVLALKWVRDHVASFGGDPEAITIFGQSAGAWSVNYHVLSPLARSLFKRAIVQSGAVVVNFLTESASGARQRTLALAETLECSTTSGDDGIVECLRNKSAHEIALAEAFVCADFVICFGAVYGDDYLPSDPLSSADVGVTKDFLLGNVENEGSVFASLQHWAQFPFKGALDVKKRDMFHFFLKSFAFAPAAVTRHIFELYLAGVDERDFPSLRAGLGHAIGDAFLRCPEVFLAERLSRQKSRLFYYELVFHSDHQAAYMDPWLGLTHFEDLQYVFGLPLRIHRSSTYSEADARFSREIIRVWTTFAKTGSPPDVNGVLWPAFDTERHSVVSLDSNNSRVGPLERLAKCRFWEALVAQKHSEVDSCS